MTLKVDNSPFDGQQVELLNRLLPTLTPDQLTWLGGYLAGVRSNAAAVPEVQAGAPAGGRENAPEVTVLFGSQTGNSQRLAKELSRRLEERGFQSTLTSMMDVKPSALKKTKRLLIVVSTHGEGAPPDNALPLHEYLHGSRAPKLGEMCFSVLALGDLSYERFCQTGKDFDRRLEQLGATRLHPRTDCDVDYDAAAESWMEGVISALCREAETSLKPAALPASAGPAAQPAATSYSRSRPFAAEVLENLNLNGRGSDKETRHLELSLEGSGLSFEPGDSLGIWPTNDPVLVDELIGHMKWNAEEPVAVGSGERPLREALMGHCEITLLTRPLMENAVEFSRNGLKDFLHEDRRAEVNAYLPGRDLLDFVRDFSLDGAPASELVPRLRRMPPRLYSIASSYRANPDEVHLTVAAVRYQAHQRDRLGVCSGLCSERLRPGDRLAVYVNENPNFRPPANGDAPVVMIGPGTGVAPFRGFLEDREETGAAGKTWLFFGDRRFRTDFLYQTDWQRWLKQGVLTRMDVAFSRDTNRKVYVQHRMAEHSRELFAWLEEGAYLYVCGDMHHMAEDVHAALLAIVEKEGAMTADEAKAYVARLQQENRYQRDVY